jgi:hypothetical protein
MARGESGAHGAARSPGSTRKGKQRGSNHGGGGGGGSSSRGGGGGHSGGGGSGLVGAAAALLGAAALNGVGEADAKASGPSLQEQRHAPGEFDFYA